MIEMFLLVFGVIFIIVFLVSWIMIPFRISEILEVLKSIDSKLDKLQTTNDKKGVHH